MARAMFAKNLALSVFLAAATLGCTAMDAATPARAEASHGIDESYFYASLSPHGVWVDHSLFGWVWYPRNRDHHWRPYQHGRWVWTDYGEWMWASYEPYGWATYHYGRWYLDPFHGWVWIPGRVWAPAWVSWRVGGGYIGWSPLGPWNYWDRYRYGRYDRHHHHHHRHHDDCRGRDDRRYHDRERDRDHDWDRRRGDYERQRRDHGDHWSFTRARDFDSDRVDRALVGRKHLPTVFERATPVAPRSEDEARQGRGISRGVDPAMIERASGRKVRPVKVEDSAAPPRKAGRRAQSDSVRVYRPKIEETKPDSPTPDRLGIARKSPRGTEPRPDSRGAGEKAGRGPVGERRPVDSDAAAIDRGPGRRPSKTDDATSPGRRGPRTPEPREPRETRETRETREPPAATRPGRAEPPRGPRPERMEPAGRAQEPKASRERGRRPEPAMGGGQGPDRNSSRPEPAARRAADETPKRERVGRQQPPTPGRKGGGRPPAVEQPRGDRASGRGGESRGSGNPAPSASRGRSDSAPGRP